MEEKNEMMTEQAEKNLKDSKEVVSAFSDLPMTSLIGRPFEEIAKGQAALCQVYLDTLAKLAYETPKESKSPKTNVLSFEYTKPVVDKMSGQLQDKTYTVNAPLLSLAPLPPILMDEETVSFVMDVNDSASDTSQSQEEASMGRPASFWDVKANISGKVSSNSTKSRQTSSTAKYDIFSRATQKEPSEGIEKLASLLSSAIEPIENGGK